MDQLDDYDFDFDDTRIALRPFPNRGDAQLLHFDGAITDHYVRDYPQLLADDIMLVFNDTKVIEARLDGVRRRQSAQGAVEAKISVTLLSPAGEAGQWRTLIKPLKKVTIGEWIVFDDDFRTQLIAVDDGQAVLQFETEGFAENLARFGRMPLPPYIERARPADDQDRIDYQPVLARYEGAVAAPTASLHFDAAMLDQLRASLPIETLTLHVGAGTFLPVKVDDITTHKMHAERGIVTETAAGRINAHRANGGRVVAVGTTALRLLETAGRSGQIVAYHDATDIFIHPGFDFNICDGLITNFHLPKSTLLMLVAGFVGFENMHAIYRHALAHNYRFFSYGDSSLLWRRNTALIRPKISQI